MKVDDLDINIVGRLVLRLAPLSSMMNHKNIKSTLDDYIDPNIQTPEAQFVRDLFVMKVPELIEKWYDGEQNARDIIARIDSRN